MKQNEFVETFNDNGEPEQFRSFSSRLKEFLQKFPQTEGYRMVVHATDILSSMPGLTSLYRAAIESGKNPAEFGLPALSRFSSQIIFRAELLDKDGQIISSASSFAEVECPDKTWEIMETNARSRVMASLGIGYELLDADEVQLEKQPKKSPQYVPVSVPVTVEPKSNQMQENESPVLVENSVVKPVVVSASSVEDAPKIKGEEFPFAVDATEIIPVQVLRQLKTLSLNKGTHVNPVKTKEEAKIERKRLMTA